MLEENTLQNYQEKNVKLMVTRTVRRNQTFGKQTFSTILTFET